MKALICRIKLSIFLLLLMRQADNFFVFSHRYLDRSEETSHVMRKGCWHSFNLSASNEEKTLLNLLFGGYGMKFRPLHDRVLVQREESEEKTAGGIIIPDTARKSQCKAKSFLLAQAHVMSRAN